MFLSLALLAQGAYAAEIGALLKSDRVSVGDGGSASVTALVWGDGEVSLSADAPDGILVLFQPGTLPAGGGPERVASGGGYVSASAAKVIVKSDGAAPGGYVVPIVVRASGQTGDLSFSPSVVLNVFVDVAGEEMQTVAVSAAPERAVVYGSTPAAPEEKENPILLYLAAAISILAVSCIIYRYA